MFYYIDVFAERAYTELSYHARYSIEAAALVQAALMQAALSQAALRQAEDLCFLRPGWWVSPHLCSMP